MFNTEQRKLRLQVKSGGPVKCDIDEVNRLAKYTNELGKVLAIHDLDSGELLSGYRDGKTHFLNRDPTTDEMDEIEAIFEDELEMKKR
jgi:hypothetical protein